MLTRLKVNGFKNLVDVDVSFGPFTCIAGLNGVGKSNLFDAISFLSAVANGPLMDAAKSVRDDQFRSTDVRSLFQKIGDNHVDQMSFEAEMLIAPQGYDDLGQVAKAAITFLRYKLILGCRNDEDSRPTGRLEILHEELTHINVRDAAAHLCFSHDPTWRKSVVVGARRGGPFISTKHVDERSLICLHQDRSGGRPREVPAETLPRSVLTTTNAAESPTALLARREMQSWRLLQLEPSALRKPDPFDAPTHVGSDGAHLASTLYHLAKHRQSGTGMPDGEASVYSNVANRVSELIEEVESVEVDVDRQRELLTLQVIDRSNSRHTARALSDGTLRFLALTVLELDPQAQGVLCLEEPENGIHPKRIEGMLRILADIAVDTELKVGPDNPLRQVIVNTHSPAVVALIDENDLLIADSIERMNGKGHSTSVRFSWLADTWRSRLHPDARTVPPGNLRFFLNPFTTALNEGNGKSKRRVVKRTDMQMLLFPARGS